MEKKDRFVLFVQVVLEVGGGEAKVNWRWENDKLTRVVQQREDAMQLRSIINILFLVANNGQISLTDRISLACQLCNSL